MDGINLVEGFLDRGRTHDAAIDPDGKENRIHAAFAHARNIHVTVGIALAEIEVLGEKALRGVVVRIEHDRGKVQLLGARGDLVGRNGARQEKSRG